VNATILPGRQEAESIAPRSTIADPSVRDQAEFADYRAEQSAGPSHQQVSSNLTKETAKAQRCPCD
jgi:hypothetical protein